MGVGGEKLGEGLEGAPGSVGSRLSMRQKRGV